MENRIVYDNGGLMIGNIDSVIKEIKREMEKDIDMSDVSTEELLKDLEDLKVQVPNVNIVCINYDTGMGYSFDYWRYNDRIKEENNMENKIKELEYAKKAVLSCLEKDGVLVDMRGLSYWAVVVEKLRKEIKESL